MVQTILSAPAPIVFTLLLGFVAAWRHDFGPKEASVLTRMVLLYAVPLALFRRHGWHAARRSGPGYCVRCRDSRGDCLLLLTCVFAVPFRISLLVGRERIGGTNCVFAGRSVHGPPFAVGLVHGLAGRLLLWCMSPLLALSWPNLALRPKGRYRIR